MPRKSAEQLRGDLGKACAQLSECRTPEHLEEAWNHLRKVLECAEPPMIENDVDSELLGGLYVLRRFVGEVCYNILNGDSRRHSPLEGRIEGGFRKMTARVQEFIKCALLTSGRGDPFVKLGHIVREYYSIIAVIDDQATPGGQNRKGD